METVVVACPTVWVTVCLLVSHDAPRHQRSQPELLLAMIMAVRVLLLLLVLLLLQLVLLLLVLLLRWMVRSTKDGRLLVVLH